MSDSDSGSNYDPSPKKKKPPPKVKKAAPVENGVAKAKKPSAPRKKTEKVKEESSADENPTAVDGDDPYHVFESLDHATDHGKKRLSIERIYQKKSQLEHILLRPDTYIGSVEFIEKTPMWIIADTGEGEQGLVQRDITFVPGLYKIFDEILVNAADNKQRDKTMNCIKVNIDRENNEISVWNNGKGIPVVHHQVEKMYVPELIFGTLLTSSNYDDSQRKVTGGRNGFGAKLCNIFSREFTVETSCREYKKAYKQTWTDNMQQTTPGQITQGVKEDYTKIVFQPDLAKFHMESLDDDIVGLMSRRAYDIAGSTTGVTVHLNGVRIPVKGFKLYVEQYLRGKTDDNGEPLKVVYEQVNARWEVAVTVSDRGFQQVSFVNSIATTKGGRHVDFVADQICQKLIEHIRKKLGKGGMNIKPFQIKNHMWLFVNCLIENPTFDSQTKENMTLQSKSFGSKCDLSDKFVQSALKCGVVEAIMAWVRFKQQDQLDKKCSSKKTSKLKGIAKLEDANDAGTKSSAQCTLIVTEGDSAKTLAVSGLGVVGRDRYGVFPLKGKMLNVREASHKQIMENAEINNLIKIIGLQYKKKYDSDDDCKTLRYGKLMVMADQDQDGSHIKGLVLNFIHTNWPSLVRRNFVEEFITPIVKATKGKEEIPFFSLPEYMEWKANTDNWHTYRIKYYKGLGTSTSKEAKEYFTDMARHRIRFRYAGGDDDGAIELAFSKKKIEERKDWLSSWMRDRKSRREAGLPDTYLYNKDTKQVSLRDFVDKELVLFSNMDNERSIPSLVDGLKPGQRKVLFTCFKRNDKREVKVAQLAGSVAEQSAYHHGEASLMSTIVGLAQNFVGSNNVNLLLPIGQFGTRLQGGKDSASPRYIFTMMNAVTRALFVPADDAVLRYLREDNQRIEPEWYCPILPVVLLNGAQGIGTGWSTNVPNYNPREIVTILQKMIADDDDASAVSLKPWYKNFRGTIEQLDDTRYMVMGEISVVNGTTIEITELPVKTWTQNYKESVLEPMLGSEKQTPQISDFKEYHTDTTVKFVVKMTEQQLAKYEKDGLHKTFKLQAILNTTSMVLFDAEGCLRRFDNVVGILKEFFTVRRKKYIDRKKYMEGLLKAQAARLSNQARFILEKIKGDIVMENKKKRVIVDKLIERNYDPDPVKRWKEEQRKKELEEDDDGGATEDEAMDVDDEAAAPVADVVDKRLSDFDYLVTMQLIKLSEEEKDKLLKERDNKQDELKSLEGQTWKDLWNGDLITFLAAIDAQEEKEVREEKEALLGKGKAVKAAAAAGRKNKPLTLAETRPSPMGQRVVPRIDLALKAKYQKVDENKEKKGTRGGGKVLKAKQNEVVLEDEDLSLAQRLLKNAASPDQANSIKRISGDFNKPKQQGIAKFMETKKPNKENAPKRGGGEKKAAGRKGKRNPWSDSDEESDGGASEGADFDDDDDDVVEVEQKKPPARANRGKAIVESDGESDQIEDDRRSMQSGSSRHSSVAPPSSPASSIVAAKPKQNEPKVFELSDDSDGDRKEVVKKAPKRAAVTQSKKAPTKKPKKDDSEDDDASFADDASLSSNDIAPRARPGRAATKKAVKYDGGSDNSDF